ncbi:MAG: protein-glutamate O-methyltransferase CheR, partial [Acidobacteriota bacterium]|nr:protein-glutamate O-methyltransferase CheR [Acidobacteriota bacterium]
MSRKIVERRAVPDQGEPDGELESLLVYLKEARGFDFTGYKRASLSRRIERRMRQVGAPGYAAYADLLEANPGEFAELFDTILINVTGFLRDPEAWEFLASDVVPATLRSKAPEDPIRIWSAGAASGEEAYSLAVLFAEAVGDERFRTTVKIYATDADEEALVQARHARYPTAAVVAAFGEERAGRFFDADGSSSVFRQDLRRSLIFGRHDLVQHPPISRIDLLVCRNTLMYFTADMQRRVLTNFHFALADRGYLFLGKSEAMVTRTTMFEAVNLKHRVFRRLPNREPFRPVFPDSGPVAADRPAVSEVSTVVRMAFEESPLAQLAVDQHGVVVAVNHHARVLFGLGLDAPGSALKD